MKKKRHHVRVCALLLLVLVLLAGLYFAARSGSDPNRYGNDFNVYYFAAQEVRDGRTPYDTSLGDWTPYLYPPLLAEWLVPITLLPLPFAAYLWFLLNVASLTLTLHMSARLAAPGRALAIVGLTFVILSRFTLDNLDYGQVNLLVAALAVAHVYFFSRGQKVTAAAALALAVAVKLTPAVIVVYHLAKRRWRYALANLALAGVLGAASFAPFGARAEAAFQTFVNRTVRNEQKFDFAYHGNQSLRGALERLGLAGNSGASLSLVLLISLLILVPFLLVIHRNGDDISASAPFFCLAVLLSPLSWKQHYVILALPLAYLIGRARGDIRPRRRAVLIVLLVVVFALFNLTSPRLIGVAAAEWCDGASLALAGGLLVYAATLACLIYPPALEESGSPG